MAGLKLGLGMKGKKDIIWGRPGGTAVKFPHSASWHRLGSWVQTAWQTPCCGRCPTYKSRGRWAWMLAQGQSSSAKRGGLAVVSSGLIFLKKQNKKNNPISKAVHKKRKLQKFLNYCMTSIYKYQCWIIWWVGKRNLNRSFKKLIKMFLM